MAFDIFYCSFEFNIMPNVCLLLLMCFFHSQLAHIQLCIWRKHVCATWNKKCRRTRGFVYSWVVGTQSKNSPLILCSKKARMSWWCPQCIPHQKYGFVREDRKPQVILDYNAGKGGVDLMDSCIEDFSCKRKTNRYPLVVFFNILDIAILNLYLIARENREIVPKKNRQM